MEIRKIVKKEAFCVKFIAAENGLPIGRAFLYILYNDLHLEPFGLLEDLFVDAAHRGHGAGSALARAAIVEARKEKCYKLICTSRFIKEDLHAWYAKLGFARHGVEFRIDL